MPVSFILTVIAYHPVVEYIKTTIPYNSYRTLTQSRGRGGGREGGGDKTAIVVLVVAMIRTCQKQFIFYLFIADPARVARQRSTIAEQIW